jgi:thiamine biosynthesis lipoprotein ApbE
VEHTIAVTVVARSGMDADGFDTALFVMQPERAMALAESLGLAVIRTGPDLRSEVTSPMRAMIELRMPLDGTPGGVAR